MLKFIDHPSVDLLKVGEAVIILDDPSTAMILNTGGMIRNGQLAVISNAWADIVRDLPKKDSLFKQKYLDRVGKKESDAIDKESVYYSANFSGNEVVLTFYI